MTQPAPDESETPTTAVPAAPDVPAAQSEELSSMRAQLDELTTRYEKAQQLAGEAETRLTQLTVARAAGLPDVFAERLRGATPEELAADATGVLDAITTAFPAPATAERPAASAPSRPVESLAPASATGTEPAVDTPEQIGRLVFGS